MATSKQQQYRGVTNINKTSCHTSSFGASWPASGPGGWTDGAAQRRDEDVPQALAPFATSRG